MSGTRLAALGELSFSGQQVSYVIVAVAIALVALGFAAALVRVVLSAGKGTQKM
jgi:K(+)-stimulated pyrophosphate-energized sodium pump